MLFAQHKNDNIRENTCVRQNKKRDGQLIIEPALFVYPAGHLSNHLVEELKAMAAIYSFGYSLFSPTYYTFTSLQNIFTRLIKLINRLNLRLSF